MRQFIVLSFCYLPENFFKNIAVLAEAFPFLPTTSFFGKQLYNLIRSAYEKAHMKGETENATS